MQEVGINPLLSLAIYQGGRVTYSKGKNFIDTITDADNIEFWKTTKHVPVSSIDEKNLKTLASLLDGSTNYTKKKVNYALDKLFNLAVVDDSNIENCIRRVRSYDGKVEDIVNILEKEKRTKLLSEIETTLKSGVKIDNPKFTRDKLKGLVGYNHKFNDILKDHKLNGKVLTLEEFHEVKMRAPRNKNKDEIEYLEKIVNSIDMPKNGELMNKVIPIEDVNKFLTNKNFNTIRGYTSKYADVKHIGVYSEMMEEFRLDYTWDGGKRGYKDIDDRYYEIRYISSDIEGRVNQPIGPDMKDRNDVKGVNTDAPPCTQNGLLGGSTVIPEFKVELKEVYDTDIDDYKWVGLTIEEAEIYEIDENGIERLIGWFDKKIKRFKPVN